MLALAGDTVPEPLTERERFPELRGSRDPTVLGRLLA